MSTTTNPIAVRGVSAVAVEIQSDAYTRRSEIIEIAQFCPPPGQSWSTSSFAAPISPPGSAKESARFRDSESIKKPV